MTQNSFVYFLYDDNFSYLILNILVFFNIPQKHSDNQNLILDNIHILKEHVISFPKLSSNCFYPSENT